MRILDLTLSAFSLPFHRPYSTAAGVTTRRDGLICRIRTEDGTLGFGEGSLLPHLPAGAGSAEEQQDLARHLLLNQSLTAPDLLELGSLSLPARTAVETACWDALARSESQPLARLVQPDAASEVEVNALIGGDSLAETLSAARKGLAQGFRTFKVKVGTAAGLQEDVRRIAALRGLIGPERALRLDANGAWSEAAAYDVLSELEPYSIEYVEQPIPPGDLAASARLRASSPIPLAADEELTGLDSARAILEAGAADVLILKPLVLGGVGPCLAVAQAAQAAGIGVTLTTTVDSGIGTALALQLAAALAPHSAAGLATLQLLKASLVLGALPIVDGRMRLPLGPGLGVSLDNRAFSKFQHLSEVTKP